MISEKDIAITKLIYGDAKTFELLFKLYYKRLILVANRLLNDVSVAEEIVGDVFTYLWEKGHEIKFTTSVGSYLFKMVKNRCLNHIKHQKTENLYLSYLQRNNLLDEMLQSLENGYEEKELTQQINDAINTLPEKCREVFILSRFGELKYREIASQLHISTKTVERHIGIALEKLRKILKYKFIL